MKRLVLAFLFAIAASVHARAEQGSLPGTRKAVERTEQASVGGRAWPRFSGVYPHLATLSTSFTEAGIGAVVPWSDRLWYISYVASSCGGGVGLYEIKPDLTVCRRPESIVGTCANRMIHRESEQLLIGPYVIDAHGNVRVFESLAKVRLTAVMRHLNDPANKVYFLGMSGRFYEADVHTLQTKQLYHLKKELGCDLPGGHHVHFKGGYTAQGRVVVANNPYTGRDQQHGSGNGRLAQWDGKTWTVLKRTAFCDVTTAHGVHAVPKDASPLYAIGWDKRSVLLAVLTDGHWTTYRLPKGSQSYDHEICTEWPRIREVEPGHLMLDMHGLYYRMSASFQAGNAGGLSPIAAHLRMTPDFCKWQGRLVLAGDQNSSMGNKHRTGGQPQSNLWFGSVEQLRQRGKPAGWGGPWHEDQIKAGIPSEPFFVGGFPRRVVHLSLGGGDDWPTARCTTDGFRIDKLPPQLATLDWVTIERGSMQKPAPGYAFEVNRDVVVYLAVQDRGEPEVPAGWEKTGMTIEWTRGGCYSDTVYKKSFPKGKITIPGHDGQDEAKAYGVPNMCFVRDASPGEDGLQITNLPGDLDGKTGGGRDGADRSADSVAFTLEIDEDGTDTWSKYQTIQLSAGGYAYHTFPDNFSGCWVRITANRDCVGSAQFFLGPHQSQERDGNGEPLFRSMPRVTDKKPRIDGGLLPFAGRLWFAACTTDASGRPAQGGGLYEIDQDMKFVRREESIPGIFTNRKMSGPAEWLTEVSAPLSIGPHLISTDGRVRTFEGLKNEHVVSSIRHPDHGRKMYFLTVEGRLIEADLTTLALEQVADIPDKLGLDGAGLRFKAGHSVGGTVIVTASAPDGRSGVLAEWDGKSWTFVDRAAFGEVSNLASMSERVIALGWDRASAILRMRNGPGRWDTYRLPKGSRTFSTNSDVAWPRIREVETERLLMNLQGIFYEMSGLTYAWSIVPVAAHNRVVSDYCSWRGLMVMAGGDAAARSDSNYVSGGKDVGLWFGETDDLWRAGDARGEGGPWLETRVQAGDTSDPYLMNGFRNKRVELRHDADSPVEFTILVDFLGTRTAWQPYKTVTVKPGEKLVHSFPGSFSAHWVRVTAGRDCAATAYFIYD